MRNTDDHGPAQTDTDGRTYEVRVVLVSRRDSRSKHVVGLTVPMGARVLTTGAAERLVADLWPGHRIAELVVRVKHNQPGAVA